MFKEKKFIIFKRYNRLERFIFPSSHSHYYFARDNGINENDVYETGLIVDKKIIIVECKDKKHLERRRDLTLFSERALLAREAESRYLYKSKEAYCLKEGD